MRFNEYRPGHMPTCSRDPEPTVGRRLPKDLRASLRDVFRTLLESEKAWKHGEPTTKADARREKNQIAKFVANSPEALRMDVDLEDEVRARPLLELLREHGKVLGPELTNAFKAFAWQMFVRDREIAAENFAESIR